MNQSRIIGSLVAIAAIVGVASAQEPKATAKRAQYPPRLDGAKAEVYKIVGDVKLKLYIYEPPGHKATDKSPAIVFFFGGGWTNGTPQQFEQQCRYLASRGIVSMTADYRVASRHQVKAVDCVRDAKSAVRWVRANAARLGIDPDRIAAGGGSAGGHIAACTATIAEFDEPSENQSISSKPNALVLFNPAAALASYEGASDAARRQVESSQIVERAGIDPKSISPAHHVTPGLPPTIMFFGTDDTLLGGAEYLARRAKEAGGRCELVTYPGEQHGFFNFGRGGNRAFLDTLRRSDEFLASLGWLSGQPTVDRFDWKADR